MRFHEPHRECLTQSMSWGSSGTSAPGSIPTILSSKFFHRLGSRMNVEFWSFSRALRFNTACLLIPTVTSAFDLVGALASGRGYAILQGRFVGSGVGKTSSMAGGGRFEAWALAAGGAC